MSLKGFVAHFFGLESWCQGSSFDSSKYGTNVRFQAGSPTICYMLPVLLRSNGSSMRFVCVCVCVCVCKYMCACLTEGAAELLHVCDPHRPLSTVLHCKGDSFR